jgi:general secretion pathway protein H
MGGRVGPDMQRTSPAWQSTERGARSVASDGVILLDVVLALAIAGLIVLAALPMLSAGTPAPLQEAYAYRIAAMLRSDRSAAMRTGGPVATTFEVARRRVISGADGSVVTLPSDLALNVQGDGTCTQAPGVFAIGFTAGGRSCGGTIRVGRSPTMWRISVNWLTGFVDVDHPKLP